MNRHPDYGAAPERIRERLQRLHRFARYVAALAVLPLAAATASAQALALKETISSEIDSAQCPPPSSFLSVAAGGSAAADSLLDEGSRAAILGDNYLAGELLREASVLAPRNPVIAYRLARTYEERGEAELALREYCRYVSIAPEAPDTDEVRERIRSLGITAAEVDREEVTAAVRAGLRAYAQGRFEAAALAFTRAIEFRPGAASAYYNRALAKLQQGRGGEASADLRTYLELRPGAPDRDAVVAWLDALADESLATQRRLPAPGGVLLQGLVIPGLGQMATGRPLYGALILGGAAAAAAYGLREVAVVRTARGTDPFGNSYEFRTEAMERKNLAQGLAVAGVIGVAGAVEAFLHARKARRAVRLRVVVERSARSYESPIAGSSANPLLEAGFSFVP